MPLQRIKGVLVFIQRAWELQVFEGILHLFLRLLIFIKNYTALLLWKPDLVAWGFLLHWKLLRVPFGREENKGVWYVHLDYLSKVVSFFHLPVCEFCLRATSVTSLDSDRVVCVRYILSSTFSPWVGFSSPSSLDDSGGPALTNKTQTKTEQPQYSNGRMYLW